MSYEDQLFGDGDNSFEMPPVNISYSNVNFTNFICRAVMSGGKQTGEYHIKLLNNASPRELMNKLRDIDTSEVGLVDTTGTLNLEFKIFMKVSGILAIESLFDILMDIDKNLKCHD